MITPRTLFASAALLLAATICLPSYGQEIAADRFGGDDLNLTSFIGEAAFSSAGDGFNEYASGANAPFGLLDDSGDSFPADSQGIIVTTGTGATLAYNSFFGAIDTINGDNPTDPLTATWTFDISGGTALQLAIDLAAMGDFEDGVNDSFPGSVPDGFSISYSIDAGPVTPWITSEVLKVPLTTQDYTLASGAVFTLDDPIAAVVGGSSTTLLNTFQTFTTAIPDGSTLDLSVTAIFDGTEAFAVDNIVITAVPEPASAGLTSLIGLVSFALIRRRNGSA